MRFKLFFILITVCNFIHSSLFENTRIVNDIQDLILGYLNDFSYVIEKRTENNCSNLIVSSDFTDLQAYGYGNSIVVENQDGYRKVLRCSMDTHFPIFDLSGVRCKGPLCFSPNGKYLCGVDTLGGGIKIWNIETEKQILQLARDVRVAKLSFGNNGKLVCYLNSEKFNNKRVEIVNRRSKRKSHIYINWVDTQKVSFSPDGCWCAISMENQDQYYIDLYKINDNLKQMTIGDHTCPIEAIAFTPDNQHIAFVASTKYVENEKMKYLSDEKVIKILELGSGSCVKTINILDGSEIKNYLSRKENRDLIKKLKSEEILKDPRFSWHISDFKYSPQATFIAITFYLPISGLFLGLGIIDRPYYLTKIINLSLNQVVRTIEGTEGVSFNLNEIFLQYVNRANTRISYILINQAHQISDFENKIKSQRQIEEANSCCVIS